MLLATDLIAIVIALVGCLTMMGVFFKQNLELRRENLRLRDYIKKSPRQSLSEYMDSPAYDWVPVISAYSGLPVDDEARYVD